MHMEIGWDMIMLMVIILLLVIQAVSQIILDVKLNRALVKFDKYVKYILEEGEGTSNPINNIEETAPKGMDERQKERLLQEVLDGFLA